MTTTLTPDTGEPLGPTAVHVKALPIRTDAPDHPVATMLGSFDLLYLVDWITSLFLFIIAIPFLIFGILLVLVVDWGNPFFVQSRVGLNSKPYRIYKIRSMRIQKHRPAEFCSHDDDRIIPGGHFLRKTRIDEIPQFINVMLGEMALVGPRPEQVPFVAQFTKSIPNYEQRLLVKPGITGLAQITQGYVDNLEGTKIKLQYDLQYINNRSFRLWSSIIFKTIKVIVFRHGAR